MSPIVNVSVVTMTTYFAAVCRSYGPVFLFYSARLSHVSRGFSISGGVLFKVIACWKVSLKQRFTNVLGVANCSPRRVEQTGRTRKNGENLSPLAAISPPHQSGTLSTFTSTPSHPPPLYFVTQQRLPVTITQRLKYESPLPWSPYILYVCIKCKDKSAVCD
jgi:hypothetical protein